VPQESADVAALKSVAVQNPVELRPLEEEVGEVAPAVRVPIRRAQDREGKGERAIGTDRVSQL
jgi:hypothetical protein